MTDESVTGDGSAQTPNILPGAFERPRRPYADPMPANSVSGLSGGSFTGGGVMAVGNGWRYKQAATDGALFALRWGLAVVLLGIVVRVTLTEILVPPLYRIMSEDLKTAREEFAAGRKMSEAGAQAAGYLQIAVDRGLLPTGKAMETMPKAAWTPKGEEAPKKP